MTVDTIPFTPATGPNPWHYSPKEAHKLLFLQRFLVYRVTGQACAAAGVTRQTLHNWREKDLKFEQAYLAVEESLTEELEAAGMARAVRESDDLLKFFLKARKRGVYGDKVDHSLEGGFTLRDFYAHGKRQIANSEETSNED